MWNLETLTPTVAGVLLALIVLHDVFHEVFHPSGQGSISSALARLVWRSMRTSRRTMPFAGPTAVVCVIGAWTATLLLAFALLYWPHLPDAFRFATGLERSDSFLTALYVSTMSVSTVGFGDVTATSIWLQLLSAAQALLGLGLLTAALGWLVQIYPVLGRRRALAQQLHMLGDSDAASLGDLDSFMWRLVGDISQVHADLVQFPITYYFRTTDDSMELAAALPGTLAWLRARPQSDRDAASLRSLSTALQLLAMRLRTEFLDTSDHTPQGVARAYARDNDAPPD